MVNNKTLTKAIDCQKKNFDTAFEMMKTFQNQGRQIMEQAFEKNFLWPDHKKACTYWGDFIKQSQENCKEYVDNSFDRIKESFAQQKTSPASEKTDKKSA